MVYTVLPDPPLQQHPWLNFPGHCTAAERVRLYEVAWLTTLQKPTGYHPVILEIGTHMGASLAAMVAGLEVQGREWTAYSVDLWRADSLQRWRKICRAYDFPSDRVTIVKGSSQEIGKTWTEVLDLAYIDGDHAPTALAQDLDNFTPHIGPGGWLAIHDCHLPMPWEIADKHLRWPRVQELARALGPVVDKWATANADDWREQETTCSMRVFRRRTT